MNEKQQPAWLGQVQQFQTSASLGEGEVVTDKPAVGAALAVIAEGMTPAAPADAAFDDWKHAVMAVYITARKYDQTVPSHWLDSMRDILLAAGPKSPKAGG